MADAKKCDRCGHYYDAYDEELDMMDEKRSTVSDGVGLCHNGYTPRYYDLCPMCLYGFVNWMNTYSNLIEIPAFNTSDESDDE